MKQLSDGSKVPSRMYYYVLDWNDSNSFKYLMNIIGKNKLHECNKKEFKKLFEIATKSDLNKYLPNKLKK